jgi:ribosomal protein S18 acetylase RimI-like enzyme
MGSHADTDAAPRVQSSIRSFFQSKSASPALPVAQTPPREQIPPPPPAANEARDPLLPPQARISPIAPDHIQPLRRINALLLPVNYPDSFYHKILDPSSVNFSHVILWEDPVSKETKVVGGIVCRLDPSLAPGSTPQAPQTLEGTFDIYLQSLALLSPYREKGLATAALRNVIAAATQQDGMRIRQLYAHVWTNNTEALAWYAARGFQKDGPVINGYYQRLKPDTAFILRRKVVPSDHLSHSSGQHTPPALSKPPPPPSPGTANPRPDTLPHTTSFQDRRPDMEWNDLPEEVLGNSLLKAPNSRSGETSSASSRSTSQSRLEGKGKKKGRAYPAAAFGA